jgi:hypothetical protein
MIALTTLFASSVSSCFPPKKRINLAKKVVIPHEEEKVGKNPCHSLKFFEFRIPNSRTVDGGHRLGAIRVAYRYSVLFVHSFLTTINSNFFKNYGTLPMPLASAFDFIISHKSVWFWIDLSEIVIPSARNAWGIPSTWN